MLFEEYLPNLAPSIEKRKYVPLKEIKEQVASYNRTLSLFEENYVHTWFSMFKESLDLGHSMELFLEKVLQGDLISPQAPNEQIQIHVFDKTSIWLDAHCSKSDKHTAQHYAEGFKNICQQKSPHFSSDTREQVESSSDIITQYQERIDSHTSLWNQLVEQDHWQRYEQENIF